MQHVGEPMTKTRPERRRLWRAATRPLAAAMAMLAAAPAAAVTPPRCPTPTDQSMFEVAALKTELMVVSITCRQEERYNDFVVRYRPQLIENDRQMNQHFERRFGRNGKRSMDAFVTNLAQARGFAGQRLGSDYCPRNTQLFAEVMALPAGNDIGIYAAGKDLIPADLPGCPVAPPPAPARSSARRR
jgi:hypothetical protein